jgi:Uma2 family endonuclease
VLERSERLDCQRPLFGLAPWGRGDTTVVVMPAAATEPQLPYRRPLTREYLRAIPDDGHRYELIDGVLLVTPAPSPQHQVALAKLFRLVDAASSEDVYVLFAPVDVVLADDTVVQPDLLVAPKDSFTDRELPVAPLLVVEVLSAHTRRIDLGLKRSRYEAAGCPSYWVVDPEVPSVTAWELRNGAYHLVGEAKADESLDLSPPFPLTIVPARLLD